jgi:hypothetical protein
MKRVIQIFCSFVLVVFLGIAVSVLMDLVVLQGPQLASHVFSPSIAKQCSKFKQGMSRSQALSEIDGIFPPQSEGLSGNYVSFVNTAGDSCVVEFDPVNNEVISAHVEPLKSSASPWNLTQRDQGPPEE